MNKVVSLVCGKWCAKTGPAKIGPLYLALKVIWTVAENRNCCCPGFANFPSCISDRRSRGRNSCNCPMLQKDSLPQEKSPAEWIHQHLSLLSVRHKAAVTASELGLSKITLGAEQLISKKWCQNAFFDVCLSWISVCSPCASHQALHMWLAVVYNQHS